MELHEAAKIIPAHYWDGSQYKVLRDDIMIHGQIEPIALYDGKIVDGVARYNICLELGIKPKFIDLDKDVDPFNYAFSMNFTRRHLTKGQLAMMAVTYANNNNRWENHLKQKKAEANNARRAALKGKRKSEFKALPESVAQQCAPPSKAAKKTLSELAQSYNLSTRIVEQAQELAKKDVQLAAKVIAGDKSLNEALKEVKEREDETGKPCIEMIKPAWIDELEKVDFKRVCKDTYWSKRSDLVISILVGCYRKFIIDFYKHRKSHEKDVSDQSFEFWLSTYGDPTINKKLDEIKGAREADAKKYSGILESVLKESETESEE